MNLSLKIIIQVSNAEQVNSQKSLNFKLSFLLKNVTRLRRCHLTDTN